MAKKQQQFTVIIEQDEDGFFIASVPALPGCHTQARTFTELKGRIREVILLCLEMARDNAAYRRQIKASSYKPIFVGLETITV